MRLLNASQRIAIAAFAAASVLDATLLFNGRAATARAGSGIFAASLGWAFVGLNVLVAAVSAIAQRGAR